MDYFSRIRKQHIEREIEYLSQVLPYPPTKINQQLTHKMLKAERKGWFKSLEKKLQEIADLMCDHLMIEKRIKITVTNDVPAGLFVMKNGTQNIYISKSRKQNFNQKVAILAHEMSHYFLMANHGIIRQNTDENELLTEVNAVYVGFGLLMLKGYLEMRKETKTTITKSRVGYIKPILIYYGIIGTTKVRKQDPKTVIRKIGLSWRFKAYYDLFKYKKEYRRLKRKANKK